ncbi:hypothetical protein F5B22DRAFT_8362 [Xylaria bambusicola]|uniref:uncharacterized protein n=1 Tax=Xylaria bambusicola TaxID=326684 RepID=UPI002007C1E6|nr:uncharacterized protein F5B22DRAFT_8362 [Xylaria bambusicola]KAI0527875.1 hypothetical protein F5B22DRAFT_8362 [Xylaria bambusicola]
MSISIRDSIRWLPNPASEPTSTIVLTSPEHRFVDVRILKDINNDDLSGRLDWAFAGISSSETRNGVRHCTWRHVVDGRTRTPEEVVDEGDIFPQDDGRTLETGHMVNPDTGKMTDYEEIWRDLEPEGIPEDTDEQPRARCVVLELKDAEREQRGMVVCLGQHCQGVMRQGDSFAAERWQWINGEWRLKFRVGELWIPGPEHIYADVISSQNKHIMGENMLQKWDVVEMSYA